MKQKKDIYLRAHTVVLDEPKQQPEKANSQRAQRPKWAKHALVFDCESRTDITQKLTFGFYRLMRLEDGAYVLEEEGAFFDDDLPPSERQILEAYIAKEAPDIASFPPRFPLYG